MTKRDTQMRKAYCWESLAYERENRIHLSNEDTTRLIYLVHDEVRIAGGYAEPRPTVDFNLRRNACAKWGELHFAPTPALATVLHECAHSLTWRPSKLAMAEHIRATAPSELTDEQLHMLDRFDRQGHGPNWVSCFVALMEKYAGSRVDYALAYADSFMMRSKGELRHHVTPAKDGIRIFTTTTSVRERKVSVKHNPASLYYWRYLFGRA